MRSSHNMPRFVMLLAVSFAILTTGSGMSQQNDSAKKDSKKDRKTAASRRYDEIVNRFIQYDVGQLRGVEGQRAYANFQNLSDEAAIPALIRGVNRAAAINNSCPIIVISNKLQSLFCASPSCFDLSAHGFGGH